tara:strand:- start:34 stop:1134 length:1101 start_codon:yes stop_codon:yes gene_type:complete
MNNILLTRFPLPYNNIGSWTKRFTKLLQRKPFLFDYVICPEPSKKINNINYDFISETLLLKKFQKLFLGYRYLPYMQKILSHKSNINNIYIIDDYNMLFELNEYLKKKKCRDKYNIFFFIHGFSYFFGNYNRKKFYNSLDYIIFLTRGSYEFELSKVHKMSAEASIIHNGIDSSIFFKLTNKDKTYMRKKYNLEVEKNIFLWAANERPKKGLKIIEKAWLNSNLYKNKNYELLIVGTNEVKKIDNIKYIGRVDTIKMSQLYQISDYYLFSTLCHEGFPLSLIEAIKCGLTCFSSDINPINEIVLNGKLSYLIEIPQDYSKWVHIFNEVNNNKIEKKDFEKSFLDNLYCYDDWEMKISDLISNAIKK